MSGPGREVPPEEIRRRESHEDVDVLAVHRQAFREPQEPGEGAEPGPWWFWAAAVLALVFGGFYLGRYSGVFAGASAVHTGVDGPAAGGAPVPGAPAGGGAAAGAGEGYHAAAADGHAVYESRCSACHQSAGQGLPGAFPPIAGSEYVQGDPERLVRIVLRGLTGPVTVKGQTFNGAMPAWADVLSDAEIAAVLSYERASFGNAAPAITSEVVAAQRSATAGRTSPWTIGELK